MNKLFLIFLVFSFGSCIAQTNAAEYIEQADKQIKKRNYDEALSILTKAIVKMPDSVNLYDSRGNLYAILQSFEKSESDFSEGFKLAQDSLIKSHFLMNRASIKSRVMNFESAYHDLKLSLTFDSTNIGAYSNLAYTTDELKRPEEAMTYYNKIIELDPEFVPVYVNLGFRSQQNGEHLKALEYFDKAAKLSPKEPLVYSNRSFSKLKTNDLKGAIKDIEKSIKMLPANCYAYKIRALILLEQGNQKEACEDLFIANKYGYEEQYGQEVNQLMRKHCN